MLSLHRDRRDRRLRLAVAATLLVAGMAAFTGAALGTKTAPAMVHLRGTAYEFNSVHTLLAGAIDPGRGVPTAPGDRAGETGRYDLAVPDRARVTPYIQAAGHHTIYLQTFTTAGEDLANVNFQTPSTPIYGALVKLLDVSVDAHGDPVRCAIVSTFSTRNVRDLELRGVHRLRRARGRRRDGERHARAPQGRVLQRRASFPTPRRPCPRRTAAWSGPGCPRASTRSAATTRSTRFASFVATCRPGRIVNANPPWGLHELAPPNPARVTATWSVRGSLDILRSLSARSLPEHAVVRVRCSGARCPLSVRTFTPATRTLNLLRALGSSVPGFRVGQTLEVAVSAHAFNGTVLRWTIVTGRRPMVSTLCVPLGETLARARC